MRTLVRWLLWKVTGRDFLPLNPSWAVMARSPELAMIGVRESCFLPVEYPFHVEEEWRIEYQIRGFGSGQLSIELGARESVAFYQGAFAVELPHVLLLERRGRKLLVNGSPVRGAQLPSAPDWLHGVLRFQSDAGRVLQRRTTHRVKRNCGTESGYFEGGAYINYDSQPGIDPQAILQSLGRFSPLRGRFLDVGCATGLLVSAALDCGLDAAGVDFSSWAVERANTRTGNKCRVLDLETAAPADFLARYDFIVMHSVIEHLADPEKALRLLFELARPGGIVYIQTLNADSLMHRLQGADWSGFSDYTHKSPWITETWLQEASVRVGFVVRSRTTHGVWNDNQHDDVWRVMGEMLANSTAATLLGQGYGDFVDIVLQRPT